MPILQRGDEVAVLPLLGTQIIQIAVVAYAGLALIELNDGAIYFTDSGVGMNSNDRIVPATEEHRAAFNNRVQQTA